MTPSEFEELAAAYSLGTLSDEEKKKFETQLDKATEEEQQVLADFSTVSSLLGISAKPVAPKPPLKNRLLTIIRKETAKTSEVLKSQFTYVFAQEGNWKHFGKGIKAKVLYADKHTHATTMLLRMEAGSQLEGHDHALTEELYMLEGDCYIAGMQLKAGDYHRAKQGSAHDITFTKQGCLMLLISRAV